MSAPLLPLLPTGAVPRGVVLSWLVLALLVVGALAGLASGSPSAASGRGALGGADLIVTVARGLGTSALVALFGTLLALLLGVAWGSLAAVMPRRVESFLLRTVDVAATAPWTILVVTLVVMVRAARPSLPSFLAELLDSRLLVVLCIAGIEWLTLARVVHARLAALRRRSFVESARMLGVPWRHVLVRHVLPHTYAPLVAYGVLALPSALAGESFLSFLGFGVESPHVSLGTLVAAGARSMSVAPLALLLPAGTLVAATVALHVAGAHLRDRLRPDRSS
jgi:oligopeptide transport system permease protein